MEKFLNKHGGKIILSSIAVIFILCLIYFIANTDEAAVKESVFFISIATFSLTFAGIYFVFWVQNKLREALKTAKGVHGVVYTAFMLLSFLVAAFLSVCFLIAPEGIFIIVISCLLGLSCAIIRVKMKKQ